MQYVIRWGAYYLEKEPRSEIISLSSCTYLTSILHPSHLIFCVEEFLYSEVIYSVPAYWHKVIDYIHEQGHPGIFR